MSAYAVICALYFSFIPYHPILMISHIEVFLKTFTFSDRFFLEGGVSVFLHSRFTSMNKECSKQFR